MKKQNGFTLIELLAVISILALLLLIVIPQVLKVINSSKKKTSSQSVELYGQAIENAISNYFMTNEDEDAVSIEKLEALNLIEYKGAKVECNEKRIINRKVYLADCKVDGNKIDYEVGKVTTNMLYERSYVKPENQDDYTFLNTNIKSAKIEIFEIHNNIEISEGYKKKIVHMHKMEV